MNILFYTTFEVSPQKGGTERITSTIANGLTRIYGAQCYSAYLCPIAKEFERTTFVKSIQLSYYSFQEEFRQFVQENNIDVVINQGEFSRVREMKEVLNEYKNKKLILVHHFNPGAEENFFNASRLYYEVKREKSIKSFIKLLFYPFFRHRHCSHWKQGYKDACKYPDKIVLLSDNFRKEFLDYAEVDSCDKFYTIHNSLSFDTFFDISHYEEKQKEVLIVSRLEERQKRISLALKIWKEIEQDDILSEWTLRVVGHGDKDIPRYMNYVHENHLKRIKFEGVQKPLPYYKSASIFMFTSAWEGWGLTLTEAQQMACVPIAFNSYSSLSDIITDGENGFSVPFNDISAYVKTMKTLMLGTDLRKNMARNAVESSHRFEQEKICADWYNLIITLLGNK